MGYFKSSRLGIETPEPSNPPAITSDLKKLGAQLDELITNPLLIKEHATSVTAATGELVEATAAITVTSPTAANGAVFGVLANGHEVKVKAASGKIYGDFIEGATEVTLTGYQHIVLQSDGTNWYIIAGEPTTTTALPKMSVVTQSGKTITAKNGEIVKTSSGEATVTSPPAAVNACFGVIFGSGSGNTLKAASGLLYIRTGNSTTYTKMPTGSKEIAVVEANQLAIFVCDGTNWFSSDELMINI